MVRLILIINTISLANESQLQKKTDCNHIFAKPVILTCMKLLLCQVSHNTLPLKVSLEKNRNIKT